MFIETSDPTIVQDQATGRELPRSAVDPADIIPAAAPVAPLPAPAAAPAPVQPTAAALDRTGDPAVDDLLVRHDAFKPPRGMQVSGVSVADGVSDATLNPMLQRTSKGYTDLSDTVLANAKAKNERDAELNTELTKQTASRQADALQEQAKQEARRVEARKQELVLRDQQDPSIDPDQFMRENGLAMVIIGALSGALGAISNDGGKGSDQVLGVITRRIDQNISAQKSQVESGRIRRGNLIDYYQKEGLDAHQAEEAARAVYLGQADRYIQLQKERNESSDALGNADTLSKQILQQRDQALDNLKLQCESKISTSYAPAPKAKAKDMGASFRAQADTDKSLEERGASPEVRRAAWAAAGTGLPFPTEKSGTELKREADERQANKPSEEDKKQVRTAKTLDNLADQLDALPKDTHSRGSEFIGRRMAKGAADYLFGEGTGDKLPLDPTRMTEQQIANRQTYEQAINSFASLQSVSMGQGALAGPEYDRAKAAAYAMSPQELARAIRTFRASQADHNSPGKIEVEDR